MTNSNAPFNLNTKRQKAFAKLVRSVWGVCAAIYEMVFDEDAPKLKDVLRGR